MLKTVIVIEDDEVLLDSYRYFINNIEDYTLKGLYATVEDALDDYKNVYPDIIISDISMPGMGGIEGAKQFKKIDSDVKIIIVSVHDDIGYIMDAIKNNADGYLTKPVNKAKIQQAFNALNANGAPLSDDVSRKLMSVFQKQKLDMFSNRENEIIQLLSQGHTYNSISEKLFVTASTVNFHIQNIYTKLGVKSKTEALKRLQELNGI